MSPALPDSSWGRDGGTFLRTLAASSERRKQGYSTRMCHCEEHSDCVVPAFEFVLGGKAVALQLQLAALPAHSVRVFNVSNLTSIYKRRHAQMSFKFVSATDAHKERWCHCE